MKGNPPPTGDELVFFSSRDPTFITLERKWDDKVEFFYVGFR